jgi:hypothetical protein
MNYRTLKFDVRAPAHGHGGKNGRNEMGCGGKEG